MNFKLYLIGGIIYVILAIILGMIGGMFAAYAVLLAALIAGIYVGMKGASPMKAAIDGIIAGIIGGIIAGIVTGFAPIPTTTGTLLDSIILVFAGMITANSPIAIGAAFAWYIAAGIILGAVGGFIGKKIKK
ncbi:MAG: hypothetical protein QXD55_00055 [Candidatus Aenigmatarchaeota archaeon]